MVMVLVFLGVVIGLGVSERYVFFFSCCSASHRSSSVKRSHTRACPPLKTKAHTHTHTQHTMADLDLDHDHDESEYSEYEDESLLRRGGGSSDESPSKPSRRWTKAEDEMLIQAVKTYQVCVCVCVCLSMV